MLVRALAKDPADRWATAGEFADALRVALAAAPPPSSVEDEEIARRPTAPLAAEADVTRTRPEIGAWEEAGWEFRTVRVDGTGAIVGRPRGRATGISLDLGGGVRLDLVTVRGGRCEMGSPAAEGGRTSDEGPVHPVEVPGVRLGRTPVTQEQWRAVSAWPRAARELPAEPSRFTGPVHPVEGVSWEEAREFCARFYRRFGLPFRLPSEAEWERACRAGSITPFHCGPVLAARVATFDRTEPYGAEAPGRPETSTSACGRGGNAFGLFDLHGNVWELCEDTWHPDYGGAPADGRAWVTPEIDRRRVMRGGAWCDLARYCRSASRSRVAPDERNDAMGFRLAVSLD